MNIWTRWRLRSRLRSAKRAVREQAYQTLRESDDPEALDFLIDALKDDDHICAEAATELGHIGDRRAVPALLAVFERHRSSSLARSAAAVALGAIGDPVALEVLLDHSLPPFYASGETIWRPTEEAVIKIGRLHPEAIIACLGRDWPKSAEDALVSLGEPAVRPLAQGMRNRNPKVRRGTARVLARIRAITAIPALASAIRDPDEETAKEAAKALGAIGGPDAVNQLLPALFDPRDDVRISAGLALADAADYRSVVTLVLALSQTRACDPVSPGDLLHEMRSAIATALSRTHAQPIPPDLEVMSGSLLPMVDSLSCALKSLGPSQALQVAAAAALGWTDDPRAVRPLITLFERESECATGVLLAAEASLRTILTTSGEGVSDDDLRAITGLPTIDRTYSVDWLCDAPRLERGGHLIECKEAKWLALEILRRRQSNTR